MAITLKINTVDKTGAIDWKSLQKQEVLTKEPDTLNFRLKNYGTKTYRPSLGDIVELYFDTDKIFAGIVIETIDETEALLKYFSVRCIDYTRELDKKLVSKTYEGMTVNAIVADILTNFAPTFTDDNVDVATVVQKIVFNYVTVSQALQKLAEMIGDCDWYVDYDKDIHFFKIGTDNAPFLLDDTSGNFIWNTLRLNTNINQLRNHIFIRGGDVEGTAFENIEVADGQKRAFFVGYNLTSFTAYKAPASDPTNYTTLAVGNDGVDDEDSYDTLYNPNKGLLRFRTNNKPAQNDRVKWSGTPIYPLLAEKSDVASIGLYGEYEYVIVDANIKSKASASQRASAELKKWGTKIHDGFFATYKNGLRTGQSLIVNSTARGISQTFKIQRISTRLNTPDTFIHEVEILASEKIGMVDVLNKLLVTNPSSQISIGENEVVDRLYSALEEITLSETFTVSKSHNPISETVSFGETAIRQPLDYAIEFVLAPYTPTIAYNGADKKRVFILDGSLLG
jgi:hypothetical protein